MTAERNTIYHLVSDVENEICNLEGCASLMQLAADGVASHHSAEAGDGLIRLATETNACVGRLREWHREAHAAVVRQRDSGPVKSAEPTKSADPPEESLEAKVRALEPWAELYARWLKHQAYGEGINAGQESVPGDEEGQFLADEESALVREIIGKPAVTDWQFAQKIEVLEHITMPDPSDWADKRDRLLLASIKDDVLAMGGRS